MIVVTGARGGQGTTTVAAAMALHAARDGDAVLVAPPRQGAAALLGVPAVQRGESVEVTAHVRLVAPPTALTAATVVVDGGQHDGLDDRLIDDGTEAYVVLRGPCYLALATLLADSGPRPDGIILVAEEGRSLTARDVSEVTDLPVVATVEATPRVARTIDAGLLPSRISRLSELRQLHSLATTPPNVATPRHAPRHHPVTNLSQTPTDLPLSRSDNGGGVVAAKDPMSRSGRARHLSLAWELPRGRAHARHWSPEPRRGRVLHRRGRHLGRGLLHRAG